MICVGLFNVLNACETDQLQTSKTDKPRKMKLSNSHAVPSTFKNFWRKNKKNRKGTSIAEEARDDETEVYQPHQDLTTPAAAMVPPTETEPSVLQAITASVELRDDVESARPGSDETNQEPNQSSTSKDLTERSQTQEEANASSESTSNNTGIAHPKKTERVPSPTKAKQHRTAPRGVRQPTPHINTGYNAREPKLSQTYSSDSDNYSWNEYDSQGNHIYLRDNESVSVLTKEYRDPNIMDVLSLEAVADVVSKGIMSREDGEKESRRLHSRLNGNMDENSLDGLINCLWNALDCCGDGSLVSERQCYADRCHGIRGGRFGSKIDLNEDGQYFDRHQKSNRKVGGAGMERISERDIAEDRLNNEMGGKSVSWADDTVDNIVLDEFLNDSLIDKDDGEQPSSKQHYNRSRTHSSDGKESKASVRSVVKSSLKNVKNMVQCATSGKQSIDADTVYEQHRKSMMNDNGLTHDNTPNLDNPNWREMVNSSGNGQNWRAAVNDSLNYQGPDSPASTTGAGPYTVGDVYGMPPSQQHCDQWGNSPPPMTGGMMESLNVPSQMPVTRMLPTHQPVNASPPPPTAMNGRIRSVGNRSVVSNMMNMTFSIDSEDIGDKYGMEGEEDIMRPASRSYNYNRTASIGGVPYGNNSQYPQHHTQQLRNQDSVIGGNSHYNDGYRVAAAPSNTMQMNTMHDHAMYHGQGRQDHAYNSATMPHQFQNGMVQLPPENYGSRVTQQTHPQMFHGMQVQPMMQGYDYQQRQPMPPPAPASPRRTFMA